MEKLFRKVYKSNFSFSIYLIVISLIKIKSDLIIRAPKDLQSQFISKKKNILYF